ncbi:Rne/Rng family ribonuclease [Sphingomonas sp.]|uniref:Rne/Rng family ribonuclease n=1 Tax=Sphingomonas sp. TaxID=28214 RepID=UPI0025D1373A|nr:Rne/Rng family ribonuclease [Sphingomonas sp.]MBV9527051.1 Rne/Rng family ribonuclease [Sphingomonas sp.]
MLIDARHPEETRVAVVKGNRIEEFDFESAEHKQLKGNIYLAKVTRVEPSLQAAFIDYGGNRHGFLAFSEIHPDYYQIPKADREALLREEAEHAAEEERLRSAQYDDDEEEESVEGSADDGHDGDEDDHAADDHSIDDHDHDDEDHPVAATGTESNRSPVDESAADELRQRRQALRRRYKIQDVIQRRQVLLVQVVKEERGNKGAALTTYLSLAGRYCVLMPNTSHGGGISRKISNGADRKRLKQVMSDLKLPTSMGLIVRTAGLSRTKTEIKRDFDYLARLWDEIRERTLGSQAPALIYRDSDLIKRAIRDLYHRDIDEVLVEGDEGYKSARGFMKLLMPSHVKRVKLHSESTPLFQRSGVEDQLSAMYQPTVQLKSGGYLVINPTEALVSIDINSGRSTREHNIEQTAFATNIEATAEIARQLRLRDMAGLVVIDFIDMEQNSHVRKVEKAMKEALKNDRARIQVGRISSFGLMEMSRQRLRTGVLEASTKPCPHCEGTGLMRTAASAGLAALRMIEDEAARGRGECVRLRAGREAAVYVLNKKRSELADIEQHYGVFIDVVIDETLEGARMTVESSGSRPVARPRPEPIAPTEEAFDEPEVDEIEDSLDDGEDDAEAPEAGAARQRGEEGEGDRHGRKRRRRRRGGRGRRREGEPGERIEPAVDEVAEAEAAPGEAAIDTDSSPLVERPTSEEPPIAETEPAEQPQPKRRRRRKEGAAEMEAGTETQADLAVPEPAPAEAPPAETVDQVAPAEDAPAPVKPARRRRGKAAAAEAPATETPAASTEAEPAAPPPPANSDSAEADDSGEPRRGGWWQRTFG